LLQVLNQEAEMVIVDSPPVLSVADAAILANAADGVVLVADAGRTRREMARRAKESLERAGANLLGMVLNRMTRQTSGYYYYYYYDQSGERSKRRRRTFHWWQVWRRLRKRLRRQPGEATEATETLVGANRA
jgi:Mrp family chromosome partitioning ATPase